MNKKNGFTVLELAVVLFIIGLVLGGAIMALTAQIDIKRSNDTQKGLEDIKEALIGFAIKNKYLPCPDKTTAAGAGVAPNTPNDGLEDVTAGGACVTQEGNVPWTTLGVSDLDAWGHRFHYRVTPAYSNHNVPFKLSDTGTLSVCQTAPGGVCSTPIAINLPAVVLSFGPNGKGAITSTGILIPAPAGPAPTPPATNADEYENTNQNNLFVSRAKSVTGGTLGEFDDQVAYLSSLVIINRMTAAGVPPGP
ncbi:MAG TPA: prepilin-type N-terminal cleavage/methylation domain-containing protein [Burkholderiaceae bacterium]|jgi:prepilin-type N-terminal cleavage/methylation domain-containing protein